MNPKDDQQVEDVVQEETQQEDLAQQLEQAKAEAEECKKNYLRALADYQNLEKRVRDERVEMMRIAQRNVIEQFLPVVDNLNQAEVFIKDPGLKMIIGSFQQALNELGVKEIELLGKEYDPHFAEVIDVLEGEEDNIIVEVVQKGYEMNGKVIRPGQVKVSKKS